MKDKDKIIEVLKEVFDHSFCLTTQLEEYADRILAIQEEAKLKKRSDEIGLLIKYTNWLLGSGYVDSDVYDEGPTAIDVFMELRDRL